MLKRLFLIFSLLLLFVLGQQASAMHAVSHAADFQEQQDDKTSHSNSACEQCLTFAKLSGAVAAGQLVLPIVSVSYSVCEEAGCNAVSLLPRAYAARAPPVHP